MRSWLTVLGAASVWIGAVSWIEAADEPAFTGLFDGKTLKGWVPQHTDGSPSRTA